MRYALHIASFLAIILIGVTSQQARAKTWLEYAGSASNGGISRQAGGDATVSMVVDQQGAPVLAWTATYDSVSRIYVKRWNGSAWEEVGADSAAGPGIGDGYRPAIAVDSQNRYLVTWAGAGYLHFGRWTGSDWEILGGSERVASVASFYGDSMGWPTVVPGPSDYPYIAVDRGNYVGYEIISFRWNGSSWVSLNTIQGSGIVSPCSSFAPNYVYRPRLAYHPSTGMHLLYEWGNHNYLCNDIYASRFNGSSWVDHPSGRNISATSGKQSRWSTPAFDSSGRLIVAWMEAPVNGRYSIYAKHDNGSGWVPYGSGTASGSGISGNIDHSAGMPTLYTNPNGILYITWLEKVGDGQYDVKVSEYKAGIWMPVGGGTISTNFSAAQPTGGEGGATPPDGAAGTGSPALATDQSGALIVAWPDLAEGNWEIYSKRLGTTGNGNYVYDTLGRLVTAKQPLGRRVFYDHDPVSNREQKTVTSQLLADRGPATPGDYHVTASQLDVSLLQLRLTANDEEVVYLTSIVFTPDGTANESAAMSALRLYLDSDHNGMYSAGDIYLSSRTTAYDNGPVAFHFGSEVSIESGQSIDLILCAYLSGSGSNGQTLHFSVSVNSDMVALGASSRKVIIPFGAPVSGAVITLDPVATTPIPSPTPTASPTPTDTPTPSPSPTATPPPNVPPLPPPDDPNPTSGTLSLDPMSSLSLPPGSDPDGYLLGHFVEVWSESTDGQGQPVVVDYRSGISGATAASYLPTQPLGNGLTYHWRAQAFDDQGAYSPFTGTFSFTVAEATPTPTASPTTTETPTPTVTATPEPSPTQPPSHLVDWPLYQ